MKHILTLLKIVVLFGFVITVAACGKMSDPKPIEGSGYPHIYPKK